MLIYEKKVEGERHIYGTFGTVPSDEDNRLEYEGFEPSISGSYFDDGKGGIKDAEGNELTVLLDGEVIVPQGGEKPEPPVPPVPPVDPVEPEKKEDIDIEVGDDAAYFVENVYNKKGSNNTINRENDEDVANNYYTLVAKNVPEDASVSIGSVDVSEDFSLSIGNNSFVKDAPYYIKDGNLFVAFPLILFEGDVRVGDEVVYAGSPSGSLEVLGASIVGNGGSVIEEVEDGFDCVMASRTDYVFYNIDEVEESDILITKKSFVDTDPDGTSVSYGFTSADKVGDEFGVWIYPFGWASDADKWNAKPKHREFTYDINVVNKGTAHIVTHLDREDM